MREQAKCLCDSAWRECLDDYLYKDLINCDDYCNMSERQKDIINEVRRSKSRLKNNESN